MPQRPPFIVSSADVAETRHHYPNSTEDMAPSRAIGRAAGLMRVGIHLVRVLPGTRTSFPHAESTEEEFVYVIQGEIDAWIDGELHRMRAGDLAAFPAGTGICHTFINDGDHDALLSPAARRTSREPHLLSAESRTPERHALRRWWDDVPRGPQGSHDGSRARATSSPRHAMLRSFVPRSGLGRTSGTRSGHAHGAGDGPAVLAGSVCGSEGAAT
jgi:uncharacterized cupin superfamily protein